METSKFSLITILNIFAVAILLCPIFVIHLIMRNNQNYCYYPADYYVDAQWAIDKVDLEKAWNICTGSSNVKVGVIDSGVDGNHIDLSENINTSLSYCFNPNLSSALQDNLGHGTHVAGIIGAKGNNGYGISGAALDIDLISLRVAGTYGGVYDGALANAVSYATNSIPILNISICGGTFDSDLFNAIFNYPGLVVCAAGNYPGGRDIDNPLHRTYPACFLGNNIIAVGNSTSNDTKAYSSNYGKMSVDLFAPGEDIYSTIPNNLYDYYSGTSMASPLVAGVAALLLSIDSSLTTTQLRDAILGGVDCCSSLSNYCATGGRLNAYKAALNVIPVIPEQANPTTFFYNNTQPKYLRMACNSAHYTLSFSGTSYFKITVYTDINDTPLYENEFYDSNNIHTISFTTNEACDIFVKVENLQAFRNSFNANVLRASHNYNTYFYYDNAYHKSRCSCGAYVLQPHVYNDLSTNCSLCGLGTLSSENEDVINRPTVLMD